MEVRADSRYRSFRTPAPSCASISASRKVDTAAFFKIPKMKMNVTQTDGRISITNEINPMPIVDDFAVVSDGSVAIVRGQDYHIDWVSPEGGIAPTPKLPFDWQRLSDEDKIAVIDSAKSAMERQRAAAAANPGAAAEGGQRISMSFSASGDGAARGTTMAAGAAPQQAFITASELPDYRPAFVQGAARADLDGNLWIRTSAVRTGGVAARSTTWSIARVSSSIGCRFPPVARSSASVAAAWST